MPSQSKHDNAIPYYVVEAMARALFPLIQQLHNEQTAPNNERQTEDGKVDTAS